MKMYEKIPEPLSENLIYPYLRFGGLWIASPSTSAKASYMFSEKVG